MTTFGSQSLAIGDVVAGRYVIEGRLGAGGMGVVCAALDRKLKRRVAIKTLGGDVAGSQSARQRLRIEAEAVASLAHPGIITLYDVVEQGDDVMLVMELVAGESLREFLRRGALELELVRRVVDGVAEALAAAHARGLVHRDVKPDNVMLRPDGRVALLDFGIAKVRSPLYPADGAAAGAALTTEGVVIGTPAYLSPEQFEGGDLTAASDQFALGVLAHELITGGLPWPTGPRMMLAIRCEAPRSAGAARAGLPAALDGVLSRAMAKQPADRYPDVVAFARALGGVLSGATSVPPARVSSPLALARTELETPVVARSSKKAVWALLALGILAAAFTLFRTSAHAPSSSPRAASSSLPTTLRYTDIPTSRTAKPEALTRFRESIRLYSSARTRDAIAMLDRALELDPEFASAHLRRALFGSVLGENMSDETRRHFALAAERRQALPQRDRELLEAVAPGFADPPDWATEAHRLDEFLARHGCDAEAWDLLGCVRTKLLHHAEAKRAFVREIACDPTATAAHPVLAEVRVLDGEEAAAKKTLEECIARDASSSECRSQLLSMLAFDGACAEMETGAREFTALIPEAAEGYKQRVDAAAGLDAPIEAVEALLRQKWARLPEKVRTATELDDDVALKTYVGDFAGALSKLAEQDRTPEPDALLLDKRVSVRVQLLAQSGDLSRAAEYGETYLRKAAARPRPEQAFFDVTAELLAAARDGRAISESDYETRRKAWVADWRRRLDAAGWSVASLIVWANAYACTAKTRVQAEAALAALPAFGALPPPRNQLWLDGCVGDILRLVGRIDEAIPRLENGARVCTFAPLQVYKDALHAGQAREAQGDTARACAWYSRVIRHWGEARPGSVDATEARLGSRRLKCSG